MVPCPYSVSGRLDWCRSCCLFYDHALATAFVLISLFSIGSYFHWLLAVVALHGPTVTMLVDGLLCPHMVQHRPFPCPDEWKDNMEKNSAWWGIVLHPLHPWHLLVCLKSRQLWRPWHLLFPLVRRYSLPLANKETPWALCPLYLLCPLTMCLLAKEEGTHLVSDRQRETRRVKGVATDTSYCGASVSTPTMRAYLGATEAPPLGTSFFTVYRQIRKRWRRGPRTPSYQAPHYSPGKEMTPFRKALLWVCCGVCGIFLLAG